jgi:hypothetical protein
MFDRHSSDESIMQERRTDNRMLCADLLELVYRDGTGSERWRIVNLEDISRAGACVQSESRIPDGTNVVLRYGGAELAGVVRYCGFRDGCCFLGIEFAADCRWSPGCFVPEHLLDPRELVERVLQRTS